MTKKRRETIEECVLYRQPMQIKEILVCPGNSFDINISYTYPLCPKCDAVLEYEYQAFCGVCGQKLKWTHFNRAKLRYAGQMVGKKIKNF